LLYYFAYIFSGAVCVFQVLKVIIRTEVNNRRL